jgi:ABC-2 type transport system ATP-binding protein
MIRAEHLSKRYGAHYALDDVSFEIGKGEIVGLLGPNGAGKSTTMNILTGYLAATAGDAYIDGINIQENPAAAKAKIGYLPEQPPLYPEMTVREYLTFVYELKGCTLPCAPHLAEIMDVVKVTDVADRLIGNLSKGYRQRVGIASALVGDPPVLIFDEPTVGLDPKQIIEVRNLLRTLGKKHTVILSTHILPEVQAVCERIIVISRGRIVANERTEDIARIMDSETRYRVKIAGGAAKDMLSVLRDRNGVRRVDLLPERDGESYAFLIEAKNGLDIRKSVFSLCVERSWVLMGMERVGMELEDIFLRLVEKSEGGERTPAKRKGK